MGDKCIRESYSINLEKKCITRFSFDFYYLKSENVCFYFCEDGIVSLYNNYNIFYVNNNRELRVIDKSKILCNDIDYILEIPNNSSYFILLRKSTSGGNLVNLEFLLFGTFSKKYKIIYKICLNEKTKNSLIAYNVFDYNDKKILFYSYNEGIKNFVRSVLISPKEGESISKCIDTDSFRVNLFAKVNSNDCILDLKYYNELKIDFLLMCGENLENKCNENRLYRFITNNNSNNFDFVNVIKFVKANNSDNEVVDGINSVPINVEKCDNCYLFGFPNGKFYIANFNKLIRDYINNPRCCK